MFSGAPPIAAKAEGEPSDDAKPKLVPTPSAGLLQAKRDLLEGKLLAVPPTGGSVHSLISPRRPPATKAAAASDTPEAEPAAATVSSNDAPATSPPAAIESSQVAASLISPRAAGRVSHNPLAALGQAFKLGKSRHTPKAADERPPESDKLPELTAGASDVCAQMDVIGNAVCMLTQPRVVICTNGIQLGVRSAAQCPRRSETAATRMTEIGAHAIVPWLR